MTIASTFTKWATTSVTGDCAGDVVVNNYFIDVRANQIVLNEVFDIGILPANHTVVDMVLAPDDLDTNASPTLALDVGLMSGTIGDETGVRTTGSEFFAADQSARTGTVSRMSRRQGFTVKPAQADRSIGVKVQAAAATPAAGRIRLMVFMAPADPEVQF